MSDKTALADLRPGQWIMQPPGPDFRPSETVNYDRGMRVTLNPGVTEVELEFSHRKLSSSVVKDGVTVIPGGPPELALTWNPYPGTWVLSATSTKPTLVVEVDGRDVHVENGSADSKVWVVLRDDAQSAAVLDAINDRIEQ